MEQKELGPDAVVCDRRGKEVRGNFVEIVDGEILCGECRRRRLDEPIFLFDLSRDDF